MSEQMHIFEQAGLGKAPFEFVAVYQHPNSCQYCGTAIVDNCVIYNGLRGRVW